MIGKHLLLTIRNLKKNLLYALFVVAGLAIGITTFLSTFQWSAWHLTFDRSFPEREQIYRLTFEEDYEGFYRHTARILHGKALNRIAFTEMLSGIESVGRIAPFRKAAFRLDDRSFYEEYAYNCDPAFLEIFEPEVIAGSPENLLTEPFTTVLTESTARKFFGDRDPVGESIDLVHQFGVDPVTYTVTAVIKDFPENSHFKISVLTSFENPVEYEGTAWTYVKLDPSVEPEEMKANLNIFIESNVNELYSNPIAPRLQPVGDIHLHSHKAREIQSNIRFRTVLIVIIVGMLVFALAWFNFTLLSFSKSQLQIQKLVIQWQMGAGRSVFFRQFLVDNLFIGSISYIIGVVLTLLIAPVVENHGGAFMFKEPMVIILSLSLLLLLIMAGALITSILSTGKLYRHLQRVHLSSKPGSPPDHTGKNLFIRAVIMLEFIITFVLLSNLILISRQTSFAMTQQLGASKQEAIHLRSLHREIVNKFEVFKERMMESPAIANVTGSLEEPTGQAMDANTFEIDGIDEGEKKLFIFPVEQEFMRFYDLEMIHGSDFPTHYDPSDSTEYFVLNETAARMISDHPGDLIGRELTLHFPHPGLIWPGPVTGIVEDFHLSGLDYEVSPMVIFPKYTWLWCFSILPAGNPEPALEHLRSVWDELFPSYPLEYYFSSSLIERLYESELIQIRLLFSFSILSIIISGLGLFALSGFFMQKRVKSAALKKIHGARIDQVIAPELLYYLWLAILSSALSVPVSLFLMERWLRNFKYRTDIPVWIFPVCVAILILFSWIAVFYHTIRLARINPVEFIKEQ
ncbi:MAG: ABC transporter permease [Bacteroidales bacterium]|nr:ABC transporter permease [Bacteroidales bacterium]